MRTPLSSWSLPARTNPRAAGPDLTLGLILTLLPLLFFWRLVTPNPADLMQISPGDFTEQYFPLRAFTAQQWVRGEVPLWNAYLYGGQPALADIQSGALYPPHVVEALLLGWGGPLLGSEIGFPLWALEWQVILHFALASLGTFGFARSTFLQQGTTVRSARFAGFIAALVFTYGGYLTGFPVQQLTILAVSTWLPWLLWGLTATLTRWRLASARESKALEMTAWRLVFAGLSDSTSRIALTSGAVALALLAGHPQTFLYIFYLTLAYTLFRAFQPGLVNGTDFVAHLGLWFVTILLGSMIAAAQLLPTLDFISRSVRADLSYQAVSAGLPLTELVSVLYPGYFGGSPEYVGIAPLVLIALALVLARPRTEIYFWAGAGLVSLLLAFGGNLFVYPLFYLLAPGFDLVRQQERAFLIYSFSAAMLAGYGAIVLVRPLSKSVRPLFSRFQQQLRTVALVALALTAFYIYGSTAATARGDEVNLFAGVLRHHLFGLLFLGGMLLLLLLRPRRWLRRPGGMTLLAIWVAYNLFTVNWRANTVPPSNPPFFASNGLVQFLQSNLSFPIARISSGGLLPGGNSAGVVYGLEDITGNTPLQLADVKTFLEQLPAWRLWQLLNVRYVIAERDIGDPGLRPVFAEAQLTVYEMADPFERARFVSRVEVEADFNQAVRRLADDSFDLHQTAIVPQPIAGPLLDPTASTVKVESTSPNRLSLSVEATGSHLLVLSQIYDPGWQAKLNGHAVDLMRVNAALQGVVIPPGQHQLELTYRPTSFTLGAIVSAIGLLLCIGLFFSNRLTVQATPFQSFNLPLPPPPPGASRNLGKHGGLGGYPPESPLACPDFLKSGTPPPPTS